MYINVSECPTEILIRPNTSKLLKWKHIEWFKFSSEFLFSKCQSSTLNPAE